MRFAAAQVLVGELPQGRGLLLPSDFVGGVLARADAGKHVAGAAAGLGKLHLAMAGDDDAAASSVDAGLHDPDFAARRVDAQPEAGESLVEQDGVLLGAPAVAGQARSKVNCGHDRTLGAGLPSVGLPGEEFLGEGGHRMPRRAGAAVLLCGFDVAGDQPAGLAPRLGDGHGIGAAAVGVAPAPAHHAGEEVGPDSGWLDCQCESDHHIVADFVLLCSGLGGADAPGEGGFLGHGRGSLFGPRG